MLDALPASALVTPAPSAYRADDETDRALLRKLAKALVSLSSNDRQLLRLRYRDGWTIKRVASELGLDQKRAYREFERVHRTLRTLLVDSTATPARRHATMHDSTVCASSSAG